MITQITLAAVMAFSTGFCQAGEMPAVCYTSAVVDKEATICEGAVSFYEKAGVEGLAEEVKSLTESLETAGCSDSCSLSAKDSVAFGKRLNGKAYASVIFTGVR